MIRNRIILKTLAMFFIVEITVSSILPTGSWALTAGPTSPEHSSFEPVDVTDMVNISTGDLVYNLPLFEVPGPGGGFPVSMAYHGGIQPELEASWAGLGWSLSTGAINRTVDGAPDDFPGVAASERIYWEGGTSYGLSTGVTFGHGALTAGLTYSSDTYRGMSVSTGITGRFGGGSLSANVNYNVNAFGQKTIKPSAAATSIYESRFDAIENGYDRVSSVSSIKSGLQYVGEMYGASYHTTSSKQAGINTKGFDFNVNIPIQGLSVQLGGMYRRYWTDEKTNTSTYGSLHFPNNQPDYNSIRTHTYDVNDLYYLESVNIPVQKTELSKNPSKGLAGTFPTYDSYMVTGQGIGGSIRPYHLKAYLSRSTELDANSQVVVQPYALGGTQKPHFRFVNDFSNSFLYGGDDFQTNLNSNTPLSFQFKDEKVTTGDGVVSGYADGKLAGSRNIEYYSKFQIAAGQASGLVQCSALGYEYDASAPAESIGAFKITNESGVNYHYALPVYAYDEYSYTGHQDYKGKHSLNLFQRPTRYAYTWLLTAMTGPDYVDENGDGLANEGDSGYWITFEYGKWADKFSWRNPAEGFNKDFDRQNNFFSKGKKEIYYLNAIKSATHTALFIKELRRDGKGVVHDITPAAIINTSERKVERIDEGGFDPVTYGTNDVRHPVSTLRLKEIFLIKNKDMPFTLSQAQRGTPYRHRIGLNTFHLGDNVLDVHDIAEDREMLLAKSIRSAHFDHDYSLCNSTTNSFISTVDELNGAAAHLAGAESGKLTLKSVRMLGKAGESVLPPIKFGYDLDAPKVRAAGYVTSSGIGHPDPVESKRFGVSFSSAESIATLEPGDIVKIYDNSNTPRFAVLISRSGGQATFQTATIPPAPGLIVTAVQKTKNPHYTKNAYDIWGFYKSDYVDFGHENISRMTSEISSKTTDAWSLRRIKTVTGAEINIAYESDTYKNSIKKIPSVVIKDVVVHDESTGRVKVFFHGRNAGDIFKVNDPVKIHAVLRRDLVSPGSSFNKCGCDGDLNWVHFWATHATNAFNSPEVLEVGENFIVMQDGALVQQLRAPARDIWVDCSTFRETHVPTSGKLYRAANGYLFTGGELQFSTNASSFSIGGGLRVKEVSVTNDFGVTNAIAYDYQQGTTSYEPLGLETNVTRIPGNDLRACMRDKETEALVEYRLNFTFKVAYRNMVHLLANARLMPGPGVMYGKVNVKEFTTKSGTIYQHPSNTTYSFEVFNPKLVDVFNKTLIVPEFSDNGYKLVTTFPTSNTKGTPAATVQGLSVADVQTSTASVQDFSAVVGTLKSIETFDAEGQKIAETTNKYLFDELSAFDFAEYRADLTRFRNQGLVEEVFADAKLVKIDNTSNYLLLGLLSKFSQFPSIQVSSTSTNYKTGVAQKTENINFDFYSGQVTGTLSSDAYGNFYATESIPAYRKYPSLGLGMSGYKNMLSQNAAENVYKVHPEPGRQIIRDGLISGSVQTWSDQLPVIRPGTVGTISQPGIWRPLANYSFVGADNVTLLPDGSYPPAQVAAFDAWNSPDTAIPGWQKNSTISLYDIYTHSLQRQDVNGLYSAVKMSSNGAEVYATASNSQYGEFAFSGAEDAEINNRYGGGVARGDAHETGRQNIDDNFATHTGSKALLVYYPGIKAFSYSLTAAAGKAYHASVWVNAMGGRLYYKLNGVTTSAPAQPSEQRKAGHWYLVEIDIPAGSSNAPLEVWCETASGTCHFDDFRVHPVQASMVSYVYNRWGELSHVLDNNNLFTQFEYDATGKLKATFRETFSSGVVKTNSVEYHYQNIQN